MNAPEGKHSSNLGLPKVSVLRFCLLTFLSALLFCMGAFVPVLGMAASMFSPTPLALLGIRENKRWMTLGIFAACASLWILFGPWFVLYFFLGECCLTFGLTLPLGKVKTGGEALFFCITVSVISKLLFLGVVVSLTGQNPFEVDQAVLRNLFNRLYAETFQGAQEAAFLKEMLDQAAQFVSHMLPSLILMSSALDSFLNYRLCETLQRRKERVFPALPSFAEWRFPRSLLWTLALAFFLPLFVESEVWSLWTALEMNLKFLVNVFFFLQGASLVWWMLLKYRVHLMLRVSIIFLLTLPFLIMWVIALGLGDMCLDLRKRPSKENDKQAF